MNKDDLNDLCAKVRKLTGIAHDLANMVEDLESQCSSAREAKLSANNTLEELEHLYCNLHTERMRRWDGASYTDMKRWIE